MLIYVIYLYDYIRLFIVHVDFIVSLYTSLEDLENAYLHPMRTLSLMAPFARLDVDVADVATQTYYILLY